MQKEELRKQMETRGYTITSWARSNGLSEYDISLISKINNNTYKGNRGRCKEIKTLLIESGFMNKECTRNVAKQ